jgi:hypothetical protein
VSKHIKYKKYDIFTSPLKVYKEIKDEKKE